MDPTEFELNHIRNDKEKVAVIRNRLSDISWWMRLLSQNIAQRANKEDQEVGKFWQARYRAVRLLDETAILACAAYVDLNPIRAALAETIEDSDYTSAQKRARELRGALSPTSLPDASQDQDAAVVSSSQSARYLSPVDLSGQDVKIGVSVTGPCGHTQGERCSDKGFLPMSLADYLSLLDWTARQVRSDKQGATPQHLAPIFERLGVSSDVWCHLVKDFGKLFSIVAGQPHQIDGHRSKSNTHRYRARLAARELLSSVQV